MRIRCEAGMAVLVLLGTRCAAVLERDGDFCHITSIGGSGLIRSIPDLMPAWERIGKASGCVGLSLEGRRGWDKLLARYGFTRNGDYLEVKKWA
jgi:hypothetical protein